MPLSKGRPPLVIPFLVIHRLVRPSPLRHFCKRRDQRLVLQVQLKHPSDDPRFVFVEDQLASGGAGDDVVAEQRFATRPFALAPCRRDLVPRPLGDDLPLELGEGEQDIQRQPPHAVGGIELLGHRDERAASGVEHLHDPAEVHQGAGEPVDLVDHHAVDLAGFDV